MSTQIVIASKNNPLKTSEPVYMDEIDNIVASQKEYFNSEVTRPVEFRIHQLKSLRKLIRQHEQILLDALYKDLGRSPIESYLSEMMLVINEINFYIKKLKSWAKAKQVDRNFFLSPSISKIYYEPFGVCLIICPWNFPFLLSMRPLISAIGAGNCITLKCSESAPNVSNVIMDMINQHFPQEYICAVDCGPSQTEQLTRSHYDFIFYTGNAKAGMSIMHAAADTFTPLVLELGGKSPAIIDETADVSLAARRIAWGKFINAGQSCIAPDYICVHISRKNDFIKALENQIVKLYSKDPINNPDYCKIINETHFQRLTQRLTDAKIIWGGNHDFEKLKIEPTLVEIESFNEPLMKEEIFGPILPILVYKDLDILIGNLKKLPKSLALYHFSKDKDAIRKVNKSLSFGGGCVNDCMMQITNRYLPFGGIGKSGFGAYVGEQGFKTFSHAKSVVERKRFMLIDLLPATPPYKESTFRAFKLIAKLIGY